MEDCLACSGATFGPSLDSASSSPQSPEMSSMAPTSGGQYHWVSEFSSPRYQKFLSYITGILRTPEVFEGTVNH